MQVLVKAEKGEDNDSVPNEQPAFYHDIDYVIRTWLEHRVHHTYPDPGGYNDQDERLMDDWHTMTMYYIRIEKGVFSAPPKMEGAQQWGDLLRD